MTPADGAASAAVPASKVPFKPLPQKGPDVTVERRADGSILVAEWVPDGRITRLVPVKA